jgi:hypothetical protein
MNVFESLSARVTPSWMNRPRLQNTISSVSGVFRTSVTYAVPIVRSVATGETRMMATAVPMMKAPTADSSVR